MAEDGNGQVKFREYIIRLPREFADLVDKALSQQRQLEDREIENSQYWCWLLALGLGEVTRLNEIARKAEQRVVSADRPVRMPGVTDVRL